MNKEQFFKELDKCETRLEIYNLLILHSRNLFEYRYLETEFFNHMTFEVSQLINVLKEAYEFLEKIKQAL